MKKRFGIFSAVLAMCVIIAVVPGALANDDGSVARIGDTYYADLQSAVDAAKDGDIIILLRDTDGVGISCDKSVTIDINGAEFSFDTSKQHLVKSGDAYTLENHTLYDVEEKQPDCTEKGWAAHKKCDCGYTTEHEIYAALGHDLEYYEGMAPTCLEAGYSDYAVCTRCDYDTYAEIAPTGHILTDTVTAPTCTEQGYTTHSCTQCDYSAVDTYVAPLGHDYIPHDAKSPTCTQIGWDAYDTCSRCDYTTYHELPLAAHEYAETVTAPTCLDAGYTTHACKNCTAVFVDSYVDALDHDYVHHEAKEPTCGDAGWDAYDTCSRCDYTTKVEIPAKGHHYVDTVTAPTCTEKGYTTHVCDICTYTLVDSYVDELGHDLSHYEGKQVTCTEPGWDEYEICSRCDYNTFVEIPATGHHYVDTVTPATCTAGGYTTHVCRDCTDTYTDSETAPLGHDYIHHEAVAPTCDTEGNNAYDTCSRCDYSTYTSIPELGHSYVTSVVEPTCTEKGYTKHACTVCTYEYKDNFVDELGHDLARYAGQKPTCEEIGWDEYDVCLRCDYTTFEEIPATGHHYTTVVKEPTCLEGGYTTYTCNDCDKTFDGDYTDPLDHDYIHHEAKAPTCTDVGWEAYDTCSRCDYTTYVEIPLTGHSYSPTVTAPTCTEKGYTTYKCAYCTDSYVTDYLDELGHDYIHHEAQAPTCTDAGWEAYDTCSRCDYSDKVEIPAKDHSMTSEVVPPTCTEDGYTLHYCTECDYSYTDELVAALTHDLIRHEAKDATCTEVGWYEYFTCSRCDYTTYEEIPLADHEFVNPTFTWHGHSCTATFKCHCGATLPVECTIIEETSLEPTCTMPGEMIYTAIAIYNEAEYSIFMTESTPATGHIYSTPQFNWTDNYRCTGRMVCRCGQTVPASCSLISSITKAPTCSEEGIRTYEATISYGGSSYVDTRECLLDTVAHKPMDSVIENRVSPTCTVDGSYDEVSYCEVCGKEVGRVKQSVPMLGHDLIHHSAKTPTCTEVGWSEYDSCTRCDYDNKYIIPANDHVYNDVTTPPTCTERGYTVRTCRVCGYSFRSNYVDELGHQFGEPEFAWENDYSAANALVNCSRCGVNSFPCTITASVAIAPTCTQKGSKTYVASVVINDELFSDVKNETVPEKGHQYVQDVISPTCTRGGYTIYTCSCGASKTSDYVKATGHQYTPTVTAPTCTEQGYTTHVCVCGDTYTDSYTDALKHKYKNGVCTRCGVGNPIIGTPSVSISCVASSGKIKLTWKAVNGADKYEIWRTTSKTGTYKKYYTTSSLSYTNTSAKPGSTYYYKVKAVNDDGLSGDFSAAVSRVCDCARPVVKTSNVASSGKIKLTWSAVDGAGKYEIWRASSKSGTYKKLYTTTGTSYTNTSASAGYTYYYKVKAISSKTSSADSAYSEIVSRTCDLPRVTPSISLSSGHPKVSWSKVSGASKYEIWRATSKSGTYTKMYTTSSTSYVNTGAKYGTTYYYKVIAVSSKTTAANSAYSTVVSIKAK